MADNTQKQGGHSQNTAHEQSYAARGPENSAPGAGKKKRSKRNETMLNQYLYETRREHVPINDAMVRKYG